MYGKTIQKFNEYEYDVVKKEDFQDYMERNIDNV